MARVQLAMVKPKIPISDMTPRQRKQFAKDFAAMLRKAVAAAQAAEEPPERA